jgi:hypothetical protein
MVVKRKWRQWRVQEDDYNMQWIDLSKASASYLNIIFGVIDTILGNTS